MPTETAVILAAGRGIRLGPLGRTIPKGFVRLDARAIIEESIGKLRSRGIVRILIVTGHLREFYEDLSKRSEGIETVHNARFATSGSMASLACARDLLDGDFLLLESDLVYEARALDAALSSPHPDLIVVSGPTGSGDEVYVEAANGLVTAISKTTVRLAVGELVGISKISMALYARMLLESRHTQSAEYETDTLAAIARDYPVRYVLLPDLVWAEIDTPEHLARVRRQVYPALRQLDPVTVEPEAAASEQTPRRLPPRSR